MRWVPVIGGSVALVVGGGVAALDYTYWSVKPGALAEDDFWDRCRNAARRGELGTGRYEGVVWSEKNEAGICEDVVGYCIVNKQEDGTMFGDALPEHQVNRTASDPASCTYLGHIFAQKSSFRKVN